MSGTYQQGGGLPFNLEGLNLYSFENPISYHRSSDESDSSSHYTQGGGHQGPIGGYTLHPYPSQPPSRPETPFIHSGGPMYHHYASGPLSPDPNLENLHYDYDQARSPHYGHEMQILHAERHLGSQPSRSDSYPPFTIGISPYQIEGSPASNSTPSLSGSELHRRIEIALRNELALPPGIPVALSSIHDPGESTRPAQTLQMLTSVAIFSSPRKKLTLQEIYTALENRFAFYKTHSDVPWKSSIRHMLSLRKEFRKVSRDITESGKGAYWELSGEPGLKRARVRKAGAKRRNHSEEGDDSADPDSIPYHQTVSRAGRVIRSPYDDRRNAISGLRVDTHARSPSSPGPYPSDSSSSSRNMDSPSATSPTFGGIGRHQYFGHQPHAESSAQGGRGGYGP